MILILADSKLVIAPVKRIEGLDINIGQEQYDGTGPGKKMVCMVCSIITYVE